MFALTREKEEEEKKKKKKHKNIPPKAQKHQKRKRKKHPTNLVALTREIKPLTSKKNAHFPFHPAWNETKKIPFCLSPLAAERPPCPCARGSNTAMGRLVIRLKKLVRHGRLTCENGASNRSRTKTKLAHTHTESQAAVCGSHQHGSLTGRDEIASPASAGAVAVRIRRSAFTWRRTGPTRMCPRRTAACSRSARRARRARH